MTHPNTDSRELKYFKRVIAEPYMNNGSLVNYQYEDCTAEVNRYTADKQKELLDSLHREIFSDAGVMDIVEIAKLLKNKKESL